MSKGIADGQLRSDTNVDALALYINALAVGTSVAAQDGATTDDLLALADLEQIPFIPADIQRQ